MEVPICDGYGFFQPDQESFGVEKRVIGCSASGLVAVRTESCRDCPTLVEDQTLEVVGEVDQPDLGGGTRQPDGADEPSHALLLVCEDVFDGRADGRLAHDPNSSVPAPAEPGTA